MKLTTKETPIPREVPNTPDPGKVRPEKDPNLAPNESNPINPKTDDPKPLNS